MAKLISTLSWIEKALFIGILKEGELNTHNRFIKQLAYHRIDDYIKTDTSIEYQGNAYTLRFSGGRFESEKSLSNGYLLPKIMYAPAERNFLSTVDRPDKLKNLPSSLYTFNDEFDAAKVLFAGGLELPINNVRFEYDKLNKIAHIVGENAAYKLRLSEASSGFQSTVPLFLVTKYLTERLLAEEDPSIQEKSLSDRRKIEKEVKSIINDPLLTAEVRQEYLRLLSAKLKRSCLINIVEEPEQNLFPLSQKKILESLLAFNNRHIENRLIITTHSPYLINYLSIAIQGQYLSSLMHKKESAKGLFEQLDKVAPEASLVDGSDVVVYELDEKNGSIARLANTEGIPSDKNFLNLSIRQGNELFDQLLEIEESL
ncbi:MAG: AAA family ATPase [Saprospiraceae bacterium]|nr:AAA family ATPase [Saprospiraceae bacterium]